MNKTVWITGGSRGIGAAAVRELAEKGWNVCFTYRFSDEKAQMLCAELGERVCAVRADMTVRQDVEAAAEKMRAAFGAPDALVCNAGVSQQKMFCDLTDSDWDEMMNGNLRSAFYAIQSALPDMVHRKSGAIVTVSSVWGVTGASCESAYAASKAGLIGLTKSLAQELGLSGIRVNCVAPGVIDTDMNRMHSAETMQELAEETSLGRIGGADEVARTIRCLCEADTSFVTGQVIGVTGGFMI